MTKGLASIRQSRRVCVVRVSNGALGGSPTPLEWGDELGMTVTVTATVVGGVKVGVVACAGVGVVGVIAIGDATAQSRGRWDRDRRP